MKQYRIYIRSNQHPRTINTPMMGRTYYSVIVVEGRQALVEKVEALKSQGEIITEICTNLGTRVWL